MIYENLPTSILKEFHNAISECLEKDNATPSGQMKPYGVREYRDWAEILQEIEAALKKRHESFTPIVLASVGTTPRPMPPEAVLYERIRQCLEYEDSLPEEAEKPYGVREHADWRNQAASLEEALSKHGYSYLPIVW